MEFKFKMVIEGVIERGVIHVVDFDLQNAFHGLNIPGASGMTLKMNIKAITHGQAKKIISKNEKLPEPERWVRI